MPACDPANLPKNCWLEADGTPIAVDRYQHAAVAAQIAPDIDPDERFAHLFNLGYVRVQWESPTRVNIAFRKPARAVRPVLTSLIDFLLASGVDVYVVAPGEGLFFREGDRRWKSHLRTLMQGPVPADWHEGYGNPHA